MTYRMATIICIFLLCCSCSRGEDASARTSAEVRTSDNDDSVSEDFSEDTDMVNSPVVITISEINSISGTQRGWFAEYMLEKYDVILKLSSDPSEADIIVDVFTGDDYDFSRYLSLDDGILFDSGENIVEYFSDSLEYVASLNDGVKKGFCGYLNYGKYKDEDNLYFIGINKTSDDPEKALSVLDFLVSPYGVMIQKCGPKGVLWSIEEGEYVPVENSQTNAVDLMMGGPIFDMYAWSASSINPEDAKVRTFYELTEMIIKR